MKLEKLNAEKAWRQLGLAFLADRRDVLYISTCRLIWSVERNTAIVITTSQGHGEGWLTILHVKPVLTDNALGFFFPKKVKKVKALIFIQLNVRCVVFTVTKPYVVHVFIPKFSVLLHVIQKSNHLDRSDMCFRMLKPSYLWSLLTLEFSVKKWKTQCNMQQGGLHTSIK